MPLVRRNNKHLNLFPSHTQRHQLQQKRLPRPRSPHNRNIGVLVHRRIKNIHNHQRTVCRIHPHKNPVPVRHLKRRKRITACRPGCEHIPFRPLKNTPVQIQQRQRRPEPLLLLKHAGNRVHVLGIQQLFHLLRPPLHLPGAVPRHRHQHAQIIELLTGRQPVLQVIPRLNGLRQIIKIRVGIRSVLNLRPVQPYPPPDPLQSLPLVLPV